MSSKETKLQICMHTVHTVPNANDPKLCRGIPLNSKGWYDVFKIFQGNTILNICWTTSPNYNLFTVATLDCAPFLFMKSY